MDSIDKTLENIEAHLAHRVQKQSEPSEQSQQKIIQLPLWPETTRGVPNSVLRSALFGAVRRGRRAYQQRVEKATIDKIKVLHTGPTLDQADLDVWEQCLHLARESGLGTRIEFSAHSFLKAIGRSTGKSQHEWLKGAFTRLSASVVEIKDGSRAYWGALLHGGARNEELGCYIIELNPKIQALFGSDCWTQIQWSERQALSGHPLAQWLHGFYSTHAKPYPYRAETLRHLCGSETAALWKFRQSLRKALNVLAEATGWSWWIDDKDLVHINKRPTKSQARHLRKKKTTSPF